MKQGLKKLRLGIAGCGAIGSRIAMSVTKDLKKHFTLTALYDLDISRSSGLARRLKCRDVVMSSVEELMESCDVMVESVNSDAAALMVAAALKADKAVLAMSVGRLFGNKSLFLLARRSRGRLMLPSGAIAGLDAVKAASLGGLRRLTLISRKPPAGFQGNVFLARKKINLDSISSETVLFEGGVKGAVARFPQNINVAAALTLAADGFPVNVRIIASPSVTTNSHEILLEGRSGTVRTLTENVPCPDNPKTSYLAVLSGILALKQMADPVRVGT